MAQREQQRRKRGCGISRKRVEALESLCATLETMHKLNEVELNGLQKYIQLTFPAFLDGGDSPTLSAMQLIDAVVFLLTRRQIEMLKEGGHPGWRVYNFARRQALEAAREEMAAQASA